MRRHIAACLLLVSLLISSGAVAESKMKALIIDGQNNHQDWPKTTFMMKKYLEDTDLFTVDIARTRFTWRGENRLKNYALDDGKNYEVVKQPTPDPDFKPQFNKYDVVISNFGFNAAPWPEETQSKFEQFVREGGGLVIVHAANNSFGDWPEYNRMIGIGGWGGRTEANGPYVYINDTGELVRDKSAGPGGHHGPQHSFSIIVRQDSHAITQGMPREWIHAKDELYDMLRGPGANMEILATAYADPTHGGTGRHEPMIMTIDYGKGRVFHTPMGHADYSVQCVGFITTLQRGTEWAATGKVTLPIPDDFPTAQQESSRSFEP